MTKILYNGRVYLGRESFCEALIIKDGRIVKTGSSNELLKQASGAEKIDAGGALVLPAFNDSHLHLISTGRRASGLECEGAKSVEEIINRGRDLITRTKPSAGAFIMGIGVNPEHFSSGEKRDPRREDLDKISSEHPVVLYRHCFHVVYCNSAALKLAGINESAPEVQGGTAEKDENSRPTGVLKENAMSLVLKIVPPSSKEEKKNFLRFAMKKAQSLGISACQSNDSSGADFEDVVSAYKEVYDESRNEGKPLLRVTMKCGISSWISTQEDMLDGLLARKRGHLWEDSQWGTFLKLGSLKLFVDGSLGGHTSWMRRPFRDKPDSKGLPVLNQETINRYVEKASAAGLQVLVHAIGDAGMDAVLTAYEKVTSASEGTSVNNAAKNPLRHGIIHCQITTPDLLERMAFNNILALVQPIFLSDDIHILESRVGPELASTSYAWASMLRLGVPLSFGTDSPISPLDPLSNIQWAVLHPNPNEKMDVYSAVDAYTAGSAFSSFDENTLGRIAPGFFADLIFLDRDIFNIPAEDIHKAKVLRTICAGETVYRAL